MQAKSDWSTRFEQAFKQLQSADAAKAQQLQDIEDAEHARDAANLARMKTTGHLKTLYKSLAAAIPHVVHQDPQQEALMRIEWMLKNGAGDPKAAAAAKAAEPTKPASAPAPTAAPATAATQVPAAAAKPAQHIGASLIGKLEGPEVILDAAKAPKKFAEAPTLADLVIRNIRRSRTTCAALSVRLGRA